MQFKRAASPERCGALCYVPIWQLIPAVGMSRAEVSIAPNRLCAVSTPLSSQQDVEGDKSSV